MNKKFLFMLGILFLGVGVAFAAGEFDNVNKVITNADTQVQTTSGAGLRTLMASSYSIWWWCFYGLSPR